eukprot:1161606-Pelagomonas_calceolata.AAC.11
MPEAMQGLSRVQPPPEGEEVPGCTCYSPGKSGRALLIVSQGTKTLETLQGILSQILEAQEQGAASS